MSYQEFYCENNSFFNPSCEEVLKNPKTNVPVFVDIKDENYNENVEKHGWQNINYKWYCKSCSKKAETKI